MIRRKLPRLDVIEAFIEAARGPNFRSAAERCAVSPAAFSRRIQAFSRLMGQEAFQRTPAGMRLTPAGRAWLARLEPIYLDMQRAAAELLSDEGAGQLTVSSPHSLAAGWLIPRLDRFRERHPTIELNLHTERTAAAVRSGRADLGLCGLGVDVAGLHAEHLFDFEISPVACPAIADSFRAGDRDDPAAGLRAYPLLTVTLPSDIWPWYSRKIGAGELPGPVATFDLMQAMYEAAATGLGVALGIQMTVGPLIRSGRLVELGLPRVKYPGAYRVVVPPNRLKSPPVRAFRSWLLDQARDHSDDWGGARGPSPAAVAPLH
jgi:DNA-binding transcriptional LysR family regulator